MSTAWGIAGVTALLCDVLNRRLVTAKGGGILSGTAKVTAQPPDRIVVDNGADSCLNLFLYEVSPNTGWSSQDLPTRGSDGRAVNKPLLALDLQYLMSAYGVGDMEAEILLGHGMQAFHETPGVSRAAMRTLFDPAPPDVPGGLPKVFRERALPLADQLESIKISPRYLKTEEMSKIWTSVNAHYRPSVAYQATVVLIESTMRVRSAPPVLSRGPGDAGANVQGSMLPPFPTLLAARSLSGQPASTIDDTLILYGHHLGGDVPKVNFENQRLKSRLTVPAAALTVSRAQPTPDELREHPLLALADTRIEVDLSQALPADSWAAGGFRVDVEVTRPGEAKPRTSNSLGIAVAPAFATSGANAPVVSVAAGVLTVKLTTTPPIRAGQTASLIIGDQEMPVPAFTTSTANPTFKGKLPPDMLVSGSTHLARLRVDGVDSLFIKHNPPPQPPAFDPAQRITIP